ncbi:MAG TPA: hypothetical protein VFU76_07715 [Terriglobales bacterium]|nr:hypothetical protein [Terriglobales bacterium]
MQMGAQGGGSRGGRFTAGVIVLVTLSNPREKFWGAILDLSPAGVSVRGLDLNSFDDFAKQVRAGEEVTPAAVFFPMHRVERIELDLRNGEIPSLCERFELKTGEAAAAVLGSDAAQEISIGCSLAEAERKFVQATLAAVDQDMARASELLGITEEQIRTVLSFGLGEMRERGR